MLLQLKTIKTSFYLVGSRSKILQRLSSTMSGDNPIVDLPGLGKLKGTMGQTAWTGKSIFQFQGVKYAEPPVGEKRFKAPVPIKGWEGVFDATKYGQVAPSYGNVKRLKLEEITESMEDCLNLCVYSKNLSDKKPVMVFIHGGGMFEGKAEEHPPNYLLEKDVVLVVPQYRLGPLGFLSTKTEKIPGNAALLDIKLALEWVQKNIANFGGDASNVTLFGQSAGAVLISALNFSPAIPDGLYHKVILQSGTSLVVWAFDDQPEMNARDIAKIAGFNPKASIEELEEYFMKLDLQTMFKAHNKHMFAAYPKGGNRSGGHRITIGGPSGVIPVTPFNNMKRGKGRKNLPMMVGCCKHDSTYSFIVKWGVIQSSIGIDDNRINAHKLLDLCNTVNGIHDHTGVVASHTIQTLLSPEIVNRGDFREMLPGLIDMSGIHVFKAPIWKEAQSHSFLNPNQTYLYSFNYRGEHTRFGIFGDTSWFMFEGGVHHTDDLLYLFPYPEDKTKLNADDQAIAKQMVEMWTSFAETGVPKADAMPEFKPMSTITGPYLRIGKESEMRESFFDEYSPTLEDIRKKREKDPNFELYNEDGKLKIDELCR